MVARTSTGALEKLLAAGDSVGALAYIRALGPQSAAAPAALMKVLLAALELKQQAPAREAYAALSRAGLTQDQVKLLADKLAAGGLHEESLVLGEQLDDEERRRFGVIEREARSNTSLGRLEAAAGAYERLTATYPYSAKAWLIAARFHRTQRNPEREAECLWEALKFSLKDLTILRRLATLKASFGQHREALELWLQTVRLSPADGEAVVGVLRQLYRLKRFDQADAWIADHRSVLVEASDGARFIELVEGRAQAVPA